MPDWNGETALAPPEFRDVGAIATWIGDWDVAKNWPASPSLQRDDAREFITRAVEKRALARLCFTVTRKEDGVFMAAAAAIEGRRFELGYGGNRSAPGYAPKRRRGGFVAFHDLKPMMSGGLYHDNPASGRVLEKLAAA